MGRQAVRIPYTANGHMVVKKGNAIGGVAVELGQVLPPGSLDHIGDRKTQQLYDARWLDMATDAEVEAYLEALGDDVLIQPRQLAPGEMLQSANVPEPDLSRLDPATLAGTTSLTPPAPAQPPVKFEAPEGGLFGTNRLPALLPVNGSDIQLGRIVQSAFMAAQITGEAWNDLPEADRDARIIERARAVGWTGEPLEPQQGGQDGAGVPEGDEGHSGTSTTPPAPPAPATEPGEAVAVFHEGFGRWFKADAAGEKVGDKMTRAQAEATTLPVIDKPAAK